MKSWYTYYLYYEGNADQILKEIIYKSIEDIEGKLNKRIRFFFIRYFENGYHIRLRLFLSEEESSVFSALFFSHISAYEFLSKMKIILKEAEYFPETDRYGNADTMIYAENQFLASSRLVLNFLIQHDSLTASNRYLFGLKVHLAFFKGMGLSSKYTRELCHKFVEGWLPVPVTLDPPEQESYRKDLLSAFQNQFDLYKTSLHKSAAEFWNSLDLTEDPCMQQFLEVNSKVYHEYKTTQLSSDAINEALLSFIHMTNNRLGIINSEESYLLFLVKQTIPLIKNYDNKSRI